MNLILDEVRKTLKLAWPITIGMIGQHLFGLLDSIMVGRHSTVELAAASFVNNLCAPALIMFYGFSSCIAVRVSQARGRGEYDQIGAILKSGLLWLLVIVSFGILGLTLIHYNLHSFGQTPEVVAAAGTFMLYYSWSFLPLAIFAGLRQFSDALEKTSLPTVMVAVGFMINTVLNWFLIFGHGGAPEMGIDGAGLATLIARTTMLILFVICLNWQKFYRPYLAGFWRVPIRRALMKNLLVIGGPSSVQFLFEVGIFASSAIVMGWFGTKTLASHQVVMNLITITFMLPMSLSIATSVRIGHATGRQAWIEVRRIGWSSVGLAAAIMTVAALFFILFRRVIPTWFTPDPEVLVIASQIFVIAAFFQVFDGTQSVLVGALRGTSDVKIPTIITFIAYWIVGGGLAVLFGFYYKLQHIGIWIGLALSLVVAAVALGIRFHLLMRARLKTPDREPVAARDLNLNV